MRILALLAMLAACLAYGLAPARAEAMTMAKSAIHSLHGGEGMRPAAHGDPCSHRAGMAHAAFCAACLALVPSPPAACEGRSPFSWPRPAPGRALTAFAPAPAEPPPRG